MRTLCIVPEEGEPWEPVGTPPDALYLYPFCEKAHGKNACGVAHVSAPDVSALLRFGTGRFGT